MRIPLFRAGGDERPIAWWECLFIPIMVPLFFIIFGVLAVASIPVEFVNRVRETPAESLLRHRLAPAGRWIEWSEVEVRLTAEQGTLIIEHRSMKGPIREWWTEDDLITAAPLPLPNAFVSPPLEESQLQLLRDYSAACLTRYLGVESGSARLTEVARTRRVRLKLAKYVVVDLGGCYTALALHTGRMLAKKYPLARVVTLLAWTDQPILFKGDAEAVFRPPGESA